MARNAKDVIWITGASSGIGEGLALEYAKRGVDLVLSARRLERLQSVAKGCESLNPNTRALALPLDIERHDAFSEAISQVIAQFGRIDVLVNNAGISQRSLAKDTLIEVDERLMRVNYLSQVALSKALLPHFFEQGRGQFVVVTSVTGLYGTPYRSGYAASKHALHGFFESLRAELPESIAVSLVSPGFVRTEITLHALTGDGSKLGQRDRGNEAGLDPAEFARRVVPQLIARKPYIIEGGPKEKFGVYLKRLSPALFSKIIRRAEVR